MKKSLNKAFLVIGVLSLMIIACSNDDNEWIHIGKTSTGENYYDKNSIQKTDQDIWKIKTKALYSEEGKKTKFAFLQSIGSNVKDARVLDHEIRIWRVDCRNKKINPFSSTIYDADDDIIVSSPEFPDKWDKILPQSLADKLRHTVCKQ